jgi:hypothetical protein
MLGQEFAVCFVKQPLLSGALASEQHLRQTRRDLETLLRQAPAGARDLKCF